MLKKLFIAFVIASAPLAAALPWEVSDELTERLVGRGAVNGEDYLVSIDVLSHDVQKDAVHVAVAVRVQDKEGNVVSDEILQMSHRLPVTHHLIDYAEWGWGTAEYKHTPLGVAHARLARDLDTHIRQSLSA